MVDEPDDTPGRWPGLKNLIVDGVTAARHKLIPHEHARGDERLTRWLDAFEDELTPHLRPLLEAHVNNPDTPPEVKQVLEKLIGPEHGTAITLLIAAIGAVVWPMAQAAVAPHVQGVANFAWERDTTLPLSAPEAALGVIRNTLAGLDPYHEAATQGLSRERFDVLVRNTGDTLGIGQLLEAFRRGIIDEARLRHGVQQSRVRDEWFDVVEALRFAPPPPGEVIAGAVKQRLSDADARTKLQQAGIDPANYEWMKNTAGRPYGIEQALHLWNRGAIGEGRVREVIAHSDVNPLFTDDILHLREYVPPVRSVVAMHRNHAIDDARATELLRENGVREVDIPGYLAEGSTARASAQRDLSVSQIARLYEQRIITHDEAATRLTALRYDAGEVQLILELADNDRAEAFRNAAVARVHNLYVARKINQAQAATDLDAIGIPHGARDTWLTLWTAERNANVATLTVSQLQGALRRGLLTLAQFNERVGAHGYTAEDVTILAHEAMPPPKAPPPATERDLSTAQVLRAYKTNTITAAEASLRLAALGWSGDEITILLQST